MSAATAFPIKVNGDLYNPAQAEDFVAMLYRHVDWQLGQHMSILGVGEKGTTQEGVFRDRLLVAPAFLGAMHGHLKRWAEHHVAGFIVPAVLTAEAHEGKGGGALDKVALLTAIVLDIDSGDVSAKAKYAIDRLGQPSMIVASGGKTEAGKLKSHLWWLLSEPTDEVERVAALRKLLAAKVGGDQSFGRATQVVRIPGSVHAKNGKASMCRILDRSDADYNLDDVADIIEAMQPMPGLPAPKNEVGPLLTMVGGMDFTPRYDTAVAALHRDIKEGGEDLTRWGEFSKVAGFNISEIRAGRLAPDAAWVALNGWVLTHMVPPWPQDRIDTEFRALFQRDIATHGPMPEPPVPWSNVPVGDQLPFEYFDDITASLTNAWRIRNLLPLDGLAAMYGSPGCGKSFLAVDMSLRIAAGLPIDGRAVKQCPVIYIAAEGQRGLAVAACDVERRDNIEPVPQRMTPNQQRGRESEADGKHHGFVPETFMAPPFEEQCEQRKAGQGSAGYKVETAASRHGHARFCNTETMSLHLTEISLMAAPGAHAVVLMDQAGWHTTGKLIAPDNLSIIALPAKCPELNPVENIWQFMREDWLSNRVFTSYDNIVDHCCEAWNKLIDQPWHIITIGRRKWACGS